MHAVGQVLASNREPGIMPAIQAVVCRFARFDVHNNAIL
jgi:hypothetical protein